MAKKKKIINPYKTFQGAFIPNAVLECKELTQSAKLCWGRLAQFAGENGKCHPTMQQIGDGVGLSLSQAKRVVKELADNGFILIVSPTGQAKLKHWPNEYFFLDHPAFRGGHERTPGSVVDDTSGDAADDTSQEVSSTAPPSKRIIQENQCNKKTVTPDGSFFDLFWKKYPKKKSKGTARKAFEKINPGKKKFSEIMVGLDQALLSPDWEKHGGKFIPHPATWLNAEGWADEDGVCLTDPVDYKRQAAGVAAEKERLRQLREKKGKIAEGGPTC